MLPRSASRLSIRLHCALLHSFPFTSAIASWAVPICRCCPSVRRPESPHSPRKAELFRPSVWSAVRVVPIIPWHVQPECERLRPFDRPSHNYLTFALPLGESL